MEGGGGSSELCSPAEPHFLRRCCGPLVPLGSRRRDLLAHFYVEVPASAGVCRATSLTVPDVPKMKYLLLEELCHEEPRKVLPIQFKKASVLK